MLPSTGDQYGRATTSGSMADDGAYELVDGFIVFRFEPPPFPPGAATDPSTASSAPEPDGAVIRGRVDDVH
jgi:hypothetical protein